MSETLLCQLLDSVNLQYNLRYDDLGRPYAGFQYEIEPGVMCGFTASARARMLRLKAHDVLHIEALERDLWRLNDVNRQWGRGAIYYDLSSYETHLGVYIDRGQPQGAEIFEALHNLRAVVWRLRRYPDCLMHPDVSPHSFDWFLLDELAHLIDTGVTLDIVEQILNEMGYDFKRLDNVLGQHFVADDQNEFFIEFFTIGNRRLGVRARHRDQEIVAANGETLMKIQDLNSQFTSGAFALQADSGRVYYWATLPLNREQIQPDLLAWMVDLGAAAMQAVDESF